MTPRCFTHYHDFAWRDLHPFPLSAVCVCNDDDSNESPRDECVHKICLFVCLFAYMYV